MPLLFKFTFIIDLMFLKNYSQQGCINLIKNRVNYNIVNYSYNLKELLFF